MPDSDTRRRWQAINRLEDGIAQAYRQQADGIGADHRLSVCGVYRAVSCVLHAERLSNYRADGADLRPGSLSSTYGRLLKDIDEALGHYVRGQFTVCLIIGVMAYLVIG